MKLRLKEHVTSRMRPIAPFSIVIAALSAALAPGPRLCAAEKSSSASPRIDAGQLPPSVHKNWEVFRDKCGRCHTTDRVFRARYKTAGEWKTVVGQMAKLRGANIKAEEQKQVEQFLAYYAAHLAPSQRAGQPPSDAPDRRDS